ncbi:hypothetical protein AB0I92_23895 [Micromonospora chalcea]|uniref:hypothetical protein n=1 Tax=Micromonospora chalcea TaxID=1874 RepID=UPI00340E30B7
MPTHRQTHQAGRHLAVGHALLRGYRAELVGAQTFITVNRRRAAVMVAGKGAWMIADIGKFTSSTIGTYVLVDVSGIHPRFFVAPGDDLRRDVQLRHQQFMDRVGVRPRNSESQHTKIKPQDVARWEDDWAAFERADGT